MCQVGHTYFKSKSAIYDVISTIDNVILTIYVETNEMCEQRGTKERHKGLGMNKTQKQKNITQANTQISFLREIVK